VQGVLPQMFGGCVSAAMLSPDVRQKGGLLRGGFRSHGVSSSNPAWTTP